MLVKELLNKYSDKILHFAISYILLDISLLFFNMMVSIVIVLAIGILKEVFDSKQVGNKFSKEDIVADLIGIATKIVVIVIGGVI